MSLECQVCFRKCKLVSGQVGACLARRNDADRRIAAENYGLVTSLALDPIEKKPLSRFHPGSRILSVGSYGCNLKCPFCQNAEISLADGRGKPDAEHITPEELCHLAEKYRDRGNIGVAYTYNEPLVGFEFVRDTARLVRSAGMKNVVVTNGCAAPWVLEEVGAYIDAMNIDLKCFHERYYREVLKGDFEMVLEFIRRAAALCHIELTTLIIPGENDSDEEILSLVSWIADLEQSSGREIPLHISRFFPRSRYADRKPTEVAKIYRIAELARKRLRWVYEGNV